MEYYLYLLVMRLPVPGQARVQERRDFLEQCWDQLGSQGRSAYQLVILKPFGSADSKP
jgi:hypothetical protein